MAKAPTHCEHCGEPFDDKPQAELARHDPDVEEDQLRRIIVHQDGCAQVLLQQGWSQA